MNRMLLTGLFPALIGAGLATGCKQSTEPAEVAPAPTSADAAAPHNDFPTLARVEYVLQCMMEQGGQNYDNLYHCACAADIIASKLSHEEFAQAQTFTYLYSTPGERGGEFRDPPQSAELRNRLKEAKALAKETCFPAVEQAPRTEQK